MSARRFQFTVDHMIGRREVELTVTYSMTRDTRPVPVVERLRNRVNDCPMPAEHLMDEAADTIEALAGVLAEANGAINSAMAQVEAEFRDHDKIADRHDKIVREFREKVRAALALARIGE